MTPASHVLWYRCGSRPGALATLVREFTEQLGDVQLSYVESRPGSGLLHPGHPPLPTIIFGPPVELSASVPLDELRLFATDAGLHAIEDAGITRWMQWTTAPLPDASAPEADWAKIDAFLSRESYPILPLDGDGARRFGIAFDRLPPNAADRQWWITEFRHHGDLFCWNLDCRLKPNAKQVNV